MTGKDLYKAWAPSGPQHWTKFAKPALFVQESEFSFDKHMLQIPNIPGDLMRYSGDNTVFIVDLPGAASVEGALALAQRGYRPVPLYNGINEKNIGGLRPVIDNKPIIDALQDGASILESLTIYDDAPPVFMLDYNRSNQSGYTFGMYDNRWSIELDDMPTGQYMVNSGISQVVVWTKGNASKDLLSIIDSYQDMGINIKIFCTDMQAFVESQPYVSPSIGASGFGFNETDSGQPITSPQIPQVQEEIRHFENARFALLIITGMAFFHLLFMFLNGAPVLWTTPTIMWITYLWVAEGVGDVIAIAMTITYLVLYLLSQRRRFLLKVALALFGIETAILVIYALYYGLMAYIGYSFALGLIVFGFPLFGIVMLISGASAVSKLDGLSDAEYYMSLDNLDGIISGRGHVRRRRHFRGFRGYGGYGGSGRGGYSGGGYRGYGGGYGGGFGG